MSEHASRAALWAFALVAVAALVVVASWGPARTEAGLAYGSDSGDATRCIASTVTCSERGETNWHCYCENGLGEQCHFEPGHQSDKDCVGGQAFE